MSTTTFPSGATALVARPNGTDSDDEFALDVRVVVALAPVGLAFCATNDGCGNTCSGSDSSCNSFVDDPV